MSGLMTCRLSPPQTHVTKDSNVRRDYPSETRGRGGSLWSQTTSTMVGQEPSDAVPSPTYSPGVGRRELPLYSRSISSKPTGSQRPRNNFLRGTNLLCGEDVTSPQDCNLAGPSHDMYVPGAGRRQGFFYSFHQPVIHEVPPSTGDLDGGYMDMSVREYMNVLSAASGAQDKVAAGPAKPVEASSPGSNNSYLPMSCASERKVSANTTQTTVGGLGSGVEVAGIEGDARTPTPPPMTDQHLLAAPPDGLPDPSSRSGSENSGNGATIHSVKDKAKDEGIRTGHEVNGTGRTRTPPPGARPRRNEVTE